MISKTWAFPALAVAAGVAAAFAMPPNGLVPLFPLCLAILAWMLPEVSPRRAALLAWLFGTALHFATTTWIAEAFLVVMPGLGMFSLGPVLALSAGMALYATLIVYLWRRFWPGADKRNASAFLALAAGLGVAEWLMGHVFTGFPWTIAALAVVDTGLAARLSGLGAYGLGLTVMAAVLGSLGAAAAMLQERRPIRREILLTIFAIGLLLAPWHIHGAQTTSRAIDVDRPVIRLVQGNTPQRQKWMVENRAPIFARHLRLSTDAADTPLTAIVWPETATPFFVLNSGSAMTTLGETAPPGGHLILGTPAQERRADGSRRATNSLVAIDDQGRAVTKYDKAHLVPFGEYVPFEEYLPFGRLVAGRGSFSPGPGIATIELDGMPSFSPLICYEVIFPGAVALDGKRPAFLLNITNDAWYGDTAGPHQHLAITRMRAIEEGLPMLRVANTGISAAFDGHGEELGRIPLNETGALDVVLPRPLPPTRYAEYGDSFFWGLIALFLAVAYGFRPRPTP